LFPRGEGRSVKQDGAIVMCWHEAENIQNPDGWPEQTGPDRVAPDSSFAQSYPPSPVTIARSLSNRKSAQMWQTNP
jgi:hypothetical protein